MIITRPYSNKEKDLLVGNENLTVVITDLLEIELKQIQAPETGWTHDLLESLNVELNNDYPDGWDAHFSNGNWIGSSEV
ncbi:hypothetical protein PPW95_25125 (plasmid) [Vibrio parahaemolyticus]|uniref:hypothetical protein n=1 Tax=Vibrio harveyi group TaxID=717610 RepID=UPI0009718CD8|nr:MULTISPECIES: hypothetical protein [Vibrio harveyi group]APX10020.1 hypothetical protein BWP24_27930 [Vibrio campbellii]APX10128.1 hypothetical protein BWP24_28480 [Vibrio campbellii]ARR10583.1 hypothetical protein Vc3S01_p40097 [Vibrio campbellii]WCP78893.1 hypothetical protein PPW95_25125 [Vibrio parahaemolyticus]WHP52911.1 hypothetical protein QMY43_25175 [Vibrio parahaemolyticus]